jgi:hypothetical protein
VQQVAGKQTDVLERKGNKCRRQTLNREKPRSVDECARLEKKGTTLGDAFFCGIAVRALSLGVQRRARGARNLIEERRRACRHQRCGDLGHSPVAAAMPNQNCSELPGHPPKLARPGKSRPGFFFGEICIVMRLEDDREARLHNPLASQTFTQYLGCQ